MSIKAVIFDLDGVIVSTDEYHFQAWKMMADEEGIYFDREINEMLRGVSRMESLDIILRKCDKSYGIHDKLELAKRKNDYYRELLNNITPKDILPGVNSVLAELKERCVKTAIGSSSKNTPFILEKIGLDNYFDAVADGNEITNSKPDPEVFLLAAKKLGTEAEECLVVEDADAGVEAALAGGMKVVGVGSAADNKSADFRVRDLTELNIKEVLK
jgi:beta-phosphoglucomutase